MQILVIRHNQDGTMHWEVHRIDGYPDTVLARALTASITAHLNTAGVVKLELIPAT